MRIDGGLVRKMARLAALGLSEGEADRLAGELSRILDHFEAIRSVPDDLLPPLPVAPAMPLRDDDPSSGPGERAYAAANAPEMARGHFVVPRVVSRNG
ncbi:MAG: Asp-tRNA(Asn)/Glu-tRNA(Gln) amidotransferase subunit GatC [Thermoanaerobaculia bacterium]